MPKNKTNIEYINISHTQRMPTIIINDLKEFRKVLNKIQPVFICVGHDDYELRVKSLSKRGDLNEKTIKEKCTEFIISNNGIAYLLPGWNYRNLFDFEKGIAQGFEYGDTYYLAKEGNFKFFEEYKESILLGYTNKNDFLTANKLGFRGCKDDIKNRKYTEYRKERSLPMEAW